MSTPILFSPVAVKSNLTSLSTLAALLPDPDIDGVPSEAWPDALRKTEREVYRWLANTHYEHLAEAVGQLERVHAAGCRFGDLLTTRSREQFVSLTAEVLVADDLLNRSYTVSTIERSGQVSPDLHVTGNGIDLAVEVHSPRELLAVDQWLREVSDLLNYVDIRGDYSSTVDTRLERSIPPDREPVDPWAPDKMLEQTGTDVFAEISEDVENALRELQPLSKEYPHPGTRLLTAVALDDVQASSDLGPDRQGSISSPGFSGYSPAGIFGTIVERAQKKAGRRQAQGVASAARALVVYLMGTKIAEDLSHPAHLKGAEQAIDKLDPREYGLDAIAFVVRSLPQGLASILTVADDTVLTIPEVQALFGSAVDG